MTRRVFGKPYLAVILGLAGLSGATSFLDCRGPDDSLLDPVAVPPASVVDAGSGVGFWSGPGDYGCESAGHPKSAQRPSPQAGNDLPPIYFAFTRLRRGSEGTDGKLDKNAWATIGMDIDDMCTHSETCDPERGQTSCKSPSSAIVFDGDRCRDNSLGRLKYAIDSIPEIGQLYKLGGDRFNCGLCAGQYNTLIRLSGYNGTPNDNLVRVDLYPSPGLEQPLALNCDSPSKTALCFLPNQPFLVDQDSMLAPNSGPDLSDAKLADPNAFVRDGYLAFSLPNDARIWFSTKAADGTGPFPMTLQNAIVTGRIERSFDGNWGLADGTMAGRMKADDVVRGFRLIGFCENDPRYSIVTAYVSSNVDVLANGEADPEKPCDALSVGIAFEARQGTAGNLAKVPSRMECALSSGDAGSSPGDGGLGVGALLACHLDRRMIYRGHASRHRL